MILDFSKLVITNFGSFLGEHELDLAAFGPGLHFIKGKNKAEPRLGANGVGKSMLSNALCWCLYGKTPDGRRNPDIQPRFGDKATSVSLFVVQPDMVQEVVRTTHPNTLILDGADTGQEQIDAFIGLSFETFTHTILLGQGRPLFFDLAPKAKMDLFSAVLNLERWEARATYASETVASLQGREASLAGGLNEMEAQLESLDGLLATAKEAWRVWRDERDQAAAADKAALKNLKAKLETRETEKAGYDLAFDSAETELKAIRKHLQDLGTTRDALLEEKSKVSTRIALHKEKARSLRTELELLGEADECPTCGQSLKGTNLNKHKSELKKELTARTTLLAQEEKTWKVCDDKLSELNNRVTNSRKSEREFQSKSETARTNLDYIIPQIADLKAQIAALEAGAKKQEKEANPYTNQVNDLKLKIKDLERDYKEAQERLKSLSEQIERTKFWIRGFKEVRLYVIEDVLQELELTTNAALDEVGLVDWMVQYSIEKETKSGTVQRGLNVFIQGPQDKAPVKWECWSGGEGQRLRLVGALALSEVLLARAGVEPKIEILDEPTRGLSDEGVVDLCEFLADRAKQLDRQTWYIDHMSVESSRFTSVLTVVKDKDGSRLVL